MPTVSSWRHWPSQVASAPARPWYGLHAGPREALVQLPETLRPAVGSSAEAKLFGRQDVSVATRLRQLSDVADRQTRTRGALRARRRAVRRAAGHHHHRANQRSANCFTAQCSVPIAALYDAGNGPGIWMIRGEPTEVAWTPVNVQSLDDESARISGAIAGRPDRRPGRAPAARRPGRSPRPSRPPWRQSRKASHERKSFQPLRPRRARALRHPVPGLPDLLAGLVAFFKLGRAEDPAFTIKVMTIVTAWPGATAQEMQDQVAEKIEKRLQELRWYDRSETYTRPGLAFTTLSLLDTTPPSEVLEEFYQARKKISDEAKTLPTGVIGPLVNDEYSDVTFALFALKARGEPQRPGARRRDPASAPAACTGREEGQHHRRTGRAHLRRVLPRAPGHPGHRSPGRVRRAQRAKRLTPAGSGNPWPRRVPASGRCLR